jgi:hypothetical protein
MASKSGSPHNKTKEGCLSAAGLLPAWSGWPAQAATLVAVCREAVLPTMSPPSLGRFEPGGGPPDSKVTCITFPIEGLDQSAAIGCGRKARFSELRF